MIINLIVIGLGILTIVLMAFGCWVLYLTANLLDRYEKETTATKKEKQRTQSAAGNGQKSRAAIRQTAQNQDPVPR